MNKSLTALLDFFLPRLCSNCKVKLNPDEYVLCTTCAVKLHRADPDKIYREYLKNFEEEKVISDFVSLYVFEKDYPIQNIIHELKYLKKFALGKFLGENIYKYYSHKIDTWQPDMIIPVPLHPLKKAERGYNQAYYIAKGISLNTNIKVISGVIKRIKYTTTQTNLNAVERKENIKDAFSIRKLDIIKGKKILLVDDVITTGATISECGKILLKNGADKIFATSAGIAA